MFDRPRTQTMDFAHDSDLPLVMLPGTLCDARVFGPVLGRLNRKATIPELGGAETALGMAELILAHAPSRFSLCGFSLGANIALHVALRAPDRVARLALIGGNAGVLAPEAMAARGASAQDSFIARGWRKSVAARCACDSSLREALEEMAASTTSTQFREQIAMSIDRPDVRPRLSELKLHTLVLCGAEDQICPYQFSLEMAELIVGAQLMLIENAGHYALLERPDAVAHALSDWLAARQPTASNSRIDYDRTQ